MTTRKKKSDFLARNEIPEGDSLCDYCEGNCCRYFALPIDTPETYREFDFVRWFLSHEKATVFRDGETFYLLVHSPCKELDEQNRCKIYARRPQICRDYSSDQCEYRNSNPYDGYFEVADQVEEYAEAVLGPRPGRSFRSPKNPDAGW